MTSDPPPDGPGAPPQAGTTPGDQEQQQQQRFSAAPAPGVPYYAGPMAPSTSGWAIASLICAIAGVVGFFLVGQILGIVFGHLALGEIKRSEGRLEGRQMALAGLIISYATLGLLVLFFAVIAIVIIVTASSIARPG